MASCLWLVFVVLMVGVLVGDPAIAFKHFEDEDLDTAHLLKKYGYPVETHKVTTPDGYILTMFRIPYGRKSPPAQSKKVILLQHGLLLSSADWIIMGVDEGLGYILADAGFDVWLGNVRGNRYSRKHISMSPHEPAFWDWSWHEQALNDLPAEIDHVLEVTGESKIFYAGHSMGTTMFYVLCSLKPEYNEKIRLMFSLSPVAFMNHLKSPFLRIVSRFSGLLTDLVSMLGIGEFNPSPFFVKAIGDTFCSDGTITQVICTSSIFLLCGFDSHELNKTALPSIMGHSPAGASTKQMLHYIQEIRSGHFRPWDYGLLGNLRHYKSYHPPDYKLKKIVAPVVLFYSRNDWLSHPTDVNRLYKALGNPVAKIEVPFSRFNHLDFVWAINGKHLLYEKLIKMTDKY